MSNNFWKSCPRQLEFFPESSCPLGKVGIEAKGNLDNLPCQWYINSEQDHYCFWKWLRRVSNDRGQFNPLLQHQVSTLLKMPSPKINAAFQTAMEKLKNLDEYQVLKELY